MTSRDERVSTALDRMFELTVVLGGLMDRRLGEHGLTPARAEVIWRLHHAGPMTQRDLSQVLECTPRNVTGLVDALSAAGFVAREAHPTDRRAVLVRLTEQGRNLAAPWQSDRSSGAEQMFAETTDDELAAFTSVMEQVLMTLRPADSAGAIEVRSSRGNRESDRRRPRRSSRRPR